MNMDNFTDERDLALLDEDRYTFFVLKRLLGGTNTLLLSDHERLIICFSCEPFPVWIWTPDGISDAEKEAAWNLAAEVCPIEEGTHIIMKYELADYFMARAKEKGMNVGYHMEMMAYECPEPKAPEVPADGRMYECTAEDAEEAAEFIAGFYTGINEEAPPQERRLAKAQEFIDNHAFFLWKTAEGKPVGCCYYKINQGLGSLGGVYTVPEYRRKHYAQHLVYGVTKRISDMGYTPMLYTDANYAASNACYQKIGYELRGRVCTIKRMEDEKMI